MENSGSQMSGNATVTATTVAQGANPRAETTLHHAPADPQVATLTRQLDELIAELRRHSVDRETVGMAETARGEIGKERPNPSVIRSLLAGIAAATSSVSAVSGLITAAQAALNLLK